MKAKKSKSTGKTKWAKRRIARRYAREAVRWPGDKRQKPLAEPLAIAPLKSRMATLKRGKMVFFDGRKRIELPLILEHASFGKGSLQGIYRRANGNIVTLRAFPKPGDERFAFIGFFSFERGDGERLIRTNIGEATFAHREPDLAHLQVRESMRGKSFGLKAGSKAEREQRARVRGKHSFFPGKEFSGFFEKLGYWMMDTIASKSGKFNPRDDLSKWHRIEAIDRKSGKARIFEFPIGKGREKE